MRELVKDLAPGDFFVAPYKFHQNSIVFGIVRIDHDYETLTYIMYDLIDGYTQQPATYNYVIDHNQYRKLESDEAFIYQLANL